MTRLEPSKRKGKSADAITCGTCGEDVERKGLFDPRATMVVHCEGSERAYGCLLTTPHHSKIFWPACWKCFQPMGCAVCVLGAVRDRKTGRIYNQDLICKPCRVKVTLESLLNGGPVSTHFMRQGNDKLEWGTISSRPTPNLGAYQLAWRQAYKAQCDAIGIDADADDTAAWKECRKVFEHFRMASIPRTKGRLALQRDRNRQVAEAGE